MINFIELKSVDVPAILLIEKQAQFNPWSEQMFNDAITAGNYCCGLIFNNNLIGYAILSTVQDEAELLTICIHPDYQARGYGKILLTHLLTYLTKKQVKNLFLEVHVANQQAIQFYQQVGFEQIGQRLGYYNHAHTPGDALTFKLSL
ncbi:MAG: ribosomal-protein-alanine N-acetyltransferase [Gammaproteobacteria bacterium RIFCSPHIGHO2_12_FULL_35_23]|nr:MAG: ribosomal-protein-alanine N-acetyltransferase [Gammaproteobacteria bacterium RIFCSPHIGHO2_12_FULL_35_23]